MRLVVKLLPAAARVIAAEAMSSADGTETGGILLGHDNVETLLVTVAGDPGPNARRSPNRFSRDLTHAQGLADLAHGRDGSVWIGEWHTHPRGPAEPSDLDLRTYTGHLTDATLDFDRFLSLIALPCPDHGWQHVNLAAWVVASDIVQAAEFVVEGSDDA